MISVRKAKYEDVKILKKLADELVPSSFKGVLNTTQIDHMLDKFYTQEALQDALESGKEYFIANKDGEDLGVVSIIKHGPNLFLMQKIYVSEKALGKGIGSALFNEVKQYVKQQQSSCTIELPINQHNPGLPFYVKHGMKKVRDAGIDMGDFFINEEVYSINIE